jgi:hypothetical protein
MPLHITKTHVRVEVKIHSFLISSPDVMSGHIYSLTALPRRKSPRYPFRRLREPQRFFGWLREGKSYKHLCDVKASSGYGKM